MSNSKRNSTLQPFEFYVKEGVVKFKPPIENQFGEFTIEFNNTQQQHQNQHLNQKTESQRVQNQSRTLDNSNYSRQIQGERRTKNERQKRFNVSQISQNFPKLDDVDGQKYDLNENLSPAKRMRIFSNQVSQDSPLIQVDQLSQDSNRIKEHQNQQSSSGTKTQNSVKIPRLPIGDDYQNQQSFSNDKAKKQFTIDPVGKVYDLCKIHPETFIIQQDPRQSIISRKSISKPKNFQRAGHITAQRKSYLDLYGEDPEIMPPEIIQQKKDHKRRKSDSFRYQYQPQFVNDQGQNRSRYPEQTSDQISGSFYQHHQPNQSFYRVNSRPNQYLEIPNSKNNQPSEQQNFMPVYNSRIQVRPGQQFYSNYIPENHVPYPVYRNISNQQQIDAQHLHQQSLINSSMSQGRNPGVLNQTNKIVYVHEPEFYPLKPEWETRITENNLHYNALTPVNNTELNPSTTMYLNDQSFASDGIQNFQQAQSNGSGQFIVKQQRNPSRRIPSKRIHAFDEILIPTLANKLQNKKNSDGQKKQNSDFFKQFNQQKLQEFEQEFYNQDIYQYDKAATIIQAAFRGHIVRKQLGQLSRNEIKIIRSNSENQRKKFVKQKSRSQVLNNNDKKKNYMQQIINWCAIKIQKIFRGNQARQYYIKFYKRLNQIQRKQMKGQRRKIKSNFNYGAHTLQALAIGWKVRRVFKLKQVKNEIYLVKEHLNSDLNQIVGVQQLKQARKNGIIKFLKFLKSHLNNGAWLKNIKRQSRISEIGNNPYQFFSFNQSPNNTKLSTSNFLNLKDKRNFRGSMSVVKSKNLNQNLLSPDTNFQHPYRGSTVIKNGYLQQEIPENTFKGPLGFIEITANNKFQPNFQSETYKSLAAKNYQRRISYNPNLNSRKMSSSSPQTERKESRNTMQPEIKGNLTVDSNNNKKQKLFDSTRKMSSAQQLTTGISSDKQQKPTRRSIGIVNTPTSTQDMSDSNMFNQRNRNSMGNIIATKNHVEQIIESSVRRSTLQNKRQQRNMINLQLSGSQNPSDLFRITEENDNDFKRKSIQNQIIVSGLSHDKNQIQNLKQYISQKFNVKEIGINLVDDGEQVQAIIDFIEPETAVLTAICLDGFEFQGQILQAKVQSIVDFQEPKPSFEIQNIPKNVSIEQINNIVSNYGEVISIEINPETKSAIVVMKNQEESMNAIISLQQGKGLKIQGSYVKIKPIQIDKQPNISNILEIQNLPREITDEEIDILQDKLEKTAKGFDFDLEIVPSADGQTSQAIVKYNNPNNQNLLIDTNQVIVSLSKFKLQDNIIKVKEADFQSIEITQIDPNIRQEVVEKQIQSLGGTVITFTKEGSAIARFNDHMDAVDAMNVLKSNNNLSQNLQIYPILIPQIVQGFDNTQKISSVQKSIPRDSLNVQQITNFQDNTQAQKKLKFDQSNLTSWQGEGGKESETNQYDFSATGQSKINFNDQQVAPGQISLQSGPRFEANKQINQNRQQAFKNNSEYQQIFEISNLQINNQKEKNFNSKNQLSNVHQVNPIVINQTNFDSNRFSQQDQSSKIQQTQSIFSSTQNSNLREDFRKSYKHVFGQTQAIQIENLPLSISESQIDLLFNQIKSSVNEAPIALDIIKSTDGLSSKAVARLELQGSNEVQFDFDKIKKQIERLDIGGVVIEAKPANFQSIEIVGLPQSYPFETLEKIIQNLGGQMIVPSSESTLAAKFDSHDLALDAIQSLDQLSQKMFGAQVNFIPYLDLKSSRYSKQNNMRKSVQNQKLINLNFQEGTYNQKANIKNKVKLTNLPKNMTYDKIRNLVSQHEDISIVSVDQNSNSAVIELGYNNSAQSVLNSIGYDKNFQGVQIQSINNPEEDIDNSKIRQSLVYSSKVLQIDNLPVNITDKEVDELFGIIQSSVKDAPISLDIITSKDGTGNKAIVSLNCSVQQALNLGVSMAHVENKLQNIKLSGQKIETHPADFLSIEIAGIPKNIPKDQIEELFNSLDGDLVHITKQGVAIVKFPSTNQAVDAISKLNNISIKSFGQKLEVIPILSSENEYQVRNNQIRKSILDQGKIKTNLKNNDTLQLKNLPKDISINQVKNLIESYGQVGQVIIDPISNTAEVQLQDQSSIQSVLTKLVQDQSILKLEIQADLKHILPPQQIIRQSILQTRNSVIRRNSIQNSKVIQINNLPVNITEYQVDQLFERLQALIPGVPISLDIANSVDGQSNQAIVRLNSSFQESLNLGISINKLQKEIENIEIGGQKIETQPAEFSLIEVTNISSSISINTIEQEIQKIGGELVTIRQDGVAIAKFLSTDHAANAIDKIYQTEIFGSQIKIAPILVPQNSEENKQGSNYENSSTSSSQGSIESDDPPQVLEIQNIPINGDKDLASLKKNLQNILGVSCTIEFFDQSNDEYIQNKNLLLVKLDATLDDQELQNKLELSNKQLQSQFNLQNIQVKQSDFNQLLIQLQGDFNKSKLKSQFIDEIKELMKQLGGEITIKEKTKTTNSAITEIQMILANNECSIEIIDKMKNLINDKFEQQKQNIKIIPVTQQIIQNFEAEKIQNNTVILNSKSFKDIEILNLQKQIQKALPEIRTQIEITKNQDQNKVSIICENPEQAILAAIKLDGISLDQGRIQAKVGNLQNQATNSFQLENLPKNISPNQIKNIISSFGNVISIQIDQTADKAIVQMETAEQVQETLAQFTIDSNLKNLGKQVQIKPLKHPRKSVINSSNIQVIQIQDLPRDITDEQTDKIFNQVQELAGNIPIQFDIIKSADGETSHGVIRIDKPIEELTNLGLNLNQVAHKINKIKLDNQPLKTSIGDFTSIEIVGLPKNSKQQLEQEITNLGGHLISFTPGVNAIARFTQTNQALNAIDKIQQQQIQFGPNVLANPILLPKTSSDTEIQQIFEKKIDVGSQFIFIDNLPNNMSTREISKLKNQLQSSLKNDNISIEILKQSNGESSKAIVNVQQSLVNISRKSVINIANNVRDIGFDLNIQQADFTSIKISGDPQQTTEDNINQLLINTNGQIQSFCEDGSVIISYKSSKEAVDAILQINKITSSHGRNKFEVVPIFKNKKQRKTTFGIRNDKLLSQEDGKNKLISIELDNLPKIVNDQQIQNLIQKYGQDTIFQRLLQQIDNDQNAKRNTVFRRSSLQTSKVLQINNLPAEMDQTQIKQLQELVSNSVQQVPIFLDILSSPRGTTSQAIVRLALSVSEQIKLGVSINSVQENLKNVKIGKQKIETKPASFSHIEIIGIPEQISQKNFETIISKLGGQILSFSQQRIAILEFNSTDQTVFAIDQINQIFWDNFETNVQINPILNQDMLNYLLTQSLQMNEIEQKIPQKMTLSQNGTQNYFSQIIGIQNLPKNLSDQQVDEFFQQIEKVTGVYSELDLINAPDGQSTQAIITFQNEATAQLAYKKLNNISYQGIPLVTNPILLQSLTLHNLPADINLSQLLQALNIVLKQPISSDQVQISKQQQYDYDLNKLVSTAEINFSSQKEAQDALKIINETLSLGGDKIIAFPNFKNLINENTINQINTNLFQNEINSQYQANDQAQQNLTIITEGEQESQASKNLIARRSSKSYSILSANILNFGGLKSNISEIELNKSHNNQGSHISIAKLIQKSDLDQYENDSLNPLTDFSGLPYTRPQSGNQYNTNQNSQKNSNRKLVNENQDQLLIPDSFQIFPPFVQKDIYENSKQNRNFESLNSQQRKTQQELDNQQTFGSPYEDSDSQTQFQVSAISKFPQSDQRNQTEQHEFNRSRNDNQQTDQKLRKKPFEFTLNKIDQASSLRQKSLDKNKNNISKYDQSNNYDFDDTSGMSPISRLSSNQNSILKDNILNDSSAEKSEFQINPQLIQHSRNVTGSFEYGPQETSEFDIQEGKINKSIQKKQNMHTRKSVAERFNNKQNKYLKVNETYQSESDNNNGGSGTKIKEVKERISKILQFTEIKQDKNFFGKKIKTSDNGDESNGEEIRQKLKPKFVIEELPRQNETQATPKTKNILSPKIINVPSQKLLNEETEIPDPNPYHIAPYNNNYSKKNPFVQSQSSEQTYTIPSNEITDTNQPVKLNNYMERKQFKNQSQKQEEQDYEDKFKVDKRNKKQSKKSNFKNIKVQNSLFDYINQQPNSGVTKTVQFIDSKNETKVKEQGSKRSIQTNKFDYSHVKSKVQFSYAPESRFKNKSRPTSKLDSQKKIQKQLDLSNQSVESPNIYQNNIENQKQDPLAFKNTYIDSLEKDYRPASSLSKKKDGAGKKPDFSHVKSKISFDKPGIIWRFNSRAGSRGNKTSKSTTNQANDNQNHSQNNSVNMDQINLISETKKRQEDCLLVSEKLDRNLKIRVFASSCLSDYPDSGLELNIKKTESPSRFKRVQNQTVDKQTKLHMSNSVIEMDKWCLTTSCPGCHKHHFHERECSNYSDRSREASRVLSLKRALSSSPDRDKQDILPDNY